MHARIAVAGDDLAERHRALHQFAQARRVRVARDHRQVRRLRARDRPARRGPAWRARARAKSRRASCPCCGGRRPRRRGGRSRPRCRAPRQAPRSHRPERHRPAPHAPRPVPARCSALTGSVVRRRASQARRFAWRGWGHGGSRAATAARAISRSANCRPMTLRGLVGAGAARAAAALAPAARTTGAPRSRRQRLHDRRRRHRRSACARPAPWRRRCRRRQRRRPSTGRSG